MHIEICIPAYNEEQIISEAVRAVSEILASIPNITWRVIVSENGSVDNTAECARAAGAHVVVLSERGKGAAIIAAARVSKADVFGFIDADLSADPSYIAILLQELKKGADIAIGSRLLQKEHVNRGMFRTITSLLFNAFRKLLLDVRVADAQCGLKLMNARGRELILQCKEQGWFLDSELLARAERLGLVIQEVQIAWDEHHFKDRVSKLSVVCDGFTALSAMIRIRKNIK